MIMALLLNFVVLCAICVGCDYVIAPIISRCQSKVTRTDVAMILCLLLPVGAFLAKGVAGLLEISPLGIVGPTYVHLTGTTSAPISVMGLVSQIWENVKQGARRLCGSK